MEQAYNQPTTAREVFQQTREACAELTALLVEENAALHRHNGKLVEEKLHHKKRLVLRLEQMLAAIKRSSSLWKTDAVAQDMARRLGQEMARFQVLARQNAAALNAAHQLRADLVMAVRNELESRVSKPQLYGATGQMSQVEGSTRLVAREV